MSYIVELSDSVFESEKWVLEVGQDVAESGRDDGRRVCPHCGRMATFLRTLQRYYCFYCKQYAD